MYYEEKKNELINKKNCLLREYEALFYKTMRLAVEMDNMDKLLLSPVDMIDWMKFVVNDEEMEKFTRLVIALQYVQSPENRNVIYNLKENIEINLGE